MPAFPVCRPPWAHAALFVIDPPYEVRCGRESECERTDGAPHREWRRCTRSEPPTTPDPPGSAIRPPGPGAPPVRDQSAPVVSACREPRTLGGSASGGALRIWPAGAVCGLDREDALPSTGGPIPWSALLSGWSPRLANEESMVRARLRQPAQRPCSRGIGMSPVGSTLRAHGLSRGVVHREAPESPWSCTRAALSES